MLSSEEKKSKMAGRNISYVKQETPAFIQQFKEKIGYKEPENVDTKFLEAEKSSLEDAADQEGEKPAVVLGKNVSQEEAEEFLSKQAEIELEGKEEHSDDDKMATEDGKFVFKKPKKRRSEETGPNENKKDKTKVKKSKSSMKKVKDTNLLSFGDDEEEG